MSLTTLTTEPTTPAPVFASPPPSPRPAGSPAEADPGCCLIVDDSDLYRDRLAEAVRERGYRVLTADGYDAAIDQVRRQPPGLAVVDLKMPGRSGLEVVKALRELSPETKCVVVTGFGSIANAVDAIHAGALNYVTKPADADEILAALHRGEGEPVGPKEYNPPTLAENEWEYIQQVLADCGGNISQTARILGIERRTLHAQTEEDAAVVRRGERHRVRVTHPCVGGSRRGGERRSVRCRPPGEDLAPARPPSFAFPSPAAPREQSPARRRRRRPPRRRSPRCRNRRRGT